MSIHATARRVLLATLKGHTHSLPVHQPLWLLAGLMLGLSVASAQEIEQAALPTREQWSVIKRTANENVWEATTYSTNPITRKVREHKTSYVQIGNALNVQQPNGTFVPTDPSLSITENGAESRNTLHRVRLAPNINVAGAVELTTEDGMILRITPLSFGYYDPVTGAAVTLGTIVDAAGWLISSNEVVFSNCFAGGFRASMHYRNSARGMSQNLVIHENLPSPQEYGLSEKSRIELFSEFAPDTPLPVSRTRTIARERDLQIRAVMEEPDLHDSTLAFGRLQMVAGHAFAAQGNPMAAIAATRAPVAKAFVELDGRKLLVESVEYSKVWETLVKLPPPREPGITNASVTPMRKVPIRRMASLEVPGIRRIETVQVGGDRNSDVAFVLDFETLNTSSTLTDFVFKGNLVYFADGTVTLAGDTVLEGGAVIKLSDSGSLEQSSGSLRCETSMYLPAVITHRDDNSIGGILTSISDGVPSITSGTALTLSYLDDTPLLKHLRFSYHGTAIATYEQSSPLDLYHMQFVDCGVAVASYFGRAVYIGNGLLHNVTTAFEGDYFDIEGEHVTVDNTSFLVNGDGNTVTFRNSIFADVQKLHDLNQNNNTYGGAYNGFYGGCNDQQQSCYPDFGSPKKEAGVYGSNPSKQPPPFYTIGSGAHYLRGKSDFRDYGQASIRQDLEDDLKQMTTFPPALLSGTISSPTTLRPHVARDNSRGAGDHLDLGFHYPIIDYLASGVIVDANTALTNGVTIAVGFTENSYGFMVRAGSLYCEGAPLRPNRLLRWNAVQEQAATYVARYLDNPTVTDSSGYDTAARFRFTEFSQMGGSACHLWLGYTIGHLDIMHSSMLNGYMTVIWYHAPGGAMNLVNTLYDRVKVNLTANSSLTAGLYNNLFLNGELVLHSMANYCTVRDNMFFTNSINENSSFVANTHNAFLASSSFYIQSSGNGNVSLTSAGLVQGPLGIYYLDSGHQAFAAGSRSEAAAGLAHFTSKVDQQKERDDGTSTVNIGLHYVALVNGKPADSDTGAPTYSGVSGPYGGDGIPDYLEDTDGDGSHDSGETSWQAFATSVVKSDFHVWLEAQAPSGSFVLSWRMKPVPNQPRIFGPALIQGSQGKQYRIKSSNGGDKGTIEIIFDQRYKGDFSSKKKLGNWSEEQEQNENGVYIDLAAPGAQWDGEWHNWGVIYDLSTVWVYVDGVLISESEWLNNMTEYLGDTTALETPEVVANPSQQQVYVNAEYVTTASVSKTVPYKWQGAIGNNSDADNGPLMHAAFRPIKKMLAIGSKLYYTSGFNEAKYPVYNFDCNNPRVVERAFYVNGDPNQRLTDQLEVEDIAIANGVLWIKYNRNVYMRQFSGVDTWTDMNRYNLATGEFLDATVSQSGFPGTFPTSQDTFPDENATTGVPSAYRLSESKLTYNNEVRWAVYDQRTEQVKVFKQNGSAWDPEYLIGLANGYDAGPKVEAFPLQTQETTSTPNLFRTRVRLGSYFVQKNNTREERAVVCWQPTDGKLWVSDTATGRMLRFNLNGTFDGTEANPAMIMYIPATYAASADPNFTSATETRVFNEYLEFEVNITADVPGTDALPSTWKLKNYWGHKYSGTTDAVVRHELQTGLFSVTTLNIAAQNQPADNRTYALAFDTSGSQPNDPDISNPLRHVELTSNGLRPTGLRRLDSRTKMEKDGTLLFIDADLGSASALFKRRSISSFNGADPQYGAAVTVLTLATNSLDPVAYNYASNSTSFVVFQPERSHGGYHLGVISQSTGQWLWKRSLPGPLDGRGSFDPFCENAGTDFCLVGNDVFFVYSGEFWRNTGQANQIMHYRLSDGAFLGQFGMPAASNLRVNAPGAAGNIFTLSPVVSGTTIFLHTNDEHSRGTHRWKVSASN